LDLYRFGIVHFYPEEEVCANRSKASAIDPEQAFQVVGKPRRGAHQAEARAGQSYPGTGFSNDAAVFLARESK
jgi:hypothetical protein